MAENADGGPLPPGWDRKYDHRTGRYYFINYFNKTTTWDDPRSRYKQLAQNIPQHVPVLEPIPLQHGSPDSRRYHVYPSNSSILPPQPAFQSPVGQLHSATYLQDLTNMRPSPVAGRPGFGTPYSSPARSATATAPSANDTEVAVTKISAMFPTVSETHIRALLIKYHHREAVVMSALQVEKYPLSTPGPGTIASPPVAGRLLGLGLGPPYDSPRLATRPPHSSPKMKLRYLKSVFPKAEETVLLDILSNSENNVQKASEKLLAMGFEKRDTPPPRLTLRQKEDEQKAAEPQAATPTPPPRMKSIEEKQKMKGRLQEQYQSVPERVITIALDSVDYDEERAAHILQIMVQEDEQKPVEQKLPLMPQPQSRPTPPPPEVPAVSPTPGRKPSEKPQSRRLKGKKETPKVSRGTSTTEDKEYKSSYTTKVTGPNRNLPKGPNDDLLLTDYMTWNGPNPDMAKGPDRSLLSERSYIARGPDPSLRKGPIFGLAKGSLYSCRRAAQTESGESRGK
ncbi:histone-lysine N-methyltransferase 2D isoform X1 [Schistocerca gregaria]|uniref:histone-lysine N-methyltransferase 2D isoform X1 n=1 Tax=Schistocerca gregaria TaxID=7010 RepID=UPI00211E9B2C|nr:histone-lysine N-methyltransferase 2D isoform X1 [Schistocerca gregaria]